MSESLAVFDKSFAEKQINKRKKKKTLGITRIPVTSNSGKKYNFQAGTNQITGKAGWTPLEIPGFDPVEPVMVIHDIMEHFPGDEYAPHNEYQAQGAMFWLRYEGGFFGLGRPSRVVIEPAFGMLFFHIISKQLETKPCPLVKEAYLPIQPNESMLEPDQTETEMQQAINNALLYGLGEDRNIVEALGIQPFRFPLNPSPNDSTFGKRGKALVTRSLQHALGWMRIGYRRAAIRYAGLDKKRLVDLYKKTMGQVERAIIVGTDKAILSLSINPENYSSEFSIRDSHSAS